MRSLFLGFILLISFILLWINIKLYSEGYNHLETQEDIALQLNFIGSELKTNNLGDRMQQVFPEGFIFSNILYGLAWCELGKSSISYRERSLLEAKYAYNEINSDHGKSTFDSNLNPENGIFYVGWNNYLLSKILSLDTTFIDYNIYKNIFLEQCQTIIKALDNSDSPYLQSYENQSWLADMFVAMASIKNFDNIFTPIYQHEIDKWLENIEKCTDKKTGMIPHKVNAQYGYVTESVRGSSISLIIRMLAEIDTTLAKKQFELFKSNFVTTTFGLPSIYEYPHGTGGSSDIDSGPVIFGVGFAGTIVSIGTFAKMGRLNSASQQYKTINAFGFPYYSALNKKYLFGRLPIADAFIAWGRASGLNVQTQSELNRESNWRAKFHLYTFLIIN